jgi:putative two-component system response regulator
MPSDERILVVEDDEEVSALLQRVLQAAGFTQLRIESDPRQVLPSYRDWHPDLLLLDLRMPHLDGVEVMQQVRARSGNTAFLPVLMLTGDLDSEARMRALTAGASDFLTKPFDPAELVLRIRNLLALRRTQRELQEAARRGEEAAAAARVEVVRRLALATALRRHGDDSDPVRVGELAGHIASAMHLPDEEVQAIRLAAPLHDIGMIGVPDELVNREGSLALEELDQIKMHTSIGARILSNSESPLLQLAEEIALYHHEAWDGSGYTPGLSGESIPLAARIVAVADTFFAMTGVRPYQTPHSVDDAVAWIEAQAGRRFDPDVVAAFKRACAMDDLPLLRPTGD